MRVRQFLAALMMLLSLSAQARAAFECAMMPGGAMAHCCCAKPQGDRCPPTNVKHCCSQVSPTDAPLAQIAQAGAPSIHAQGDAVSVLLPPDFSLIPATLATPAIQRPPAALDARPHRALPLYLQTARLRL